MKRRSIAFWIMISILMLGCTACFSKGNEFRPDQVIENALQTDESISYYAESETRMSENGENYTSSTSKQWISKDGKVRMETIHDDGTVLIVTSTLDKIQIYDTDSKELLEGDFSDLEEINYSPKEQMTLLIEGIQDTHKIEYLGEEKIIGRKTHHIKAIPRDKTSLNGEQEHWFDTEYWIALKTKFTFGDTMSEIVYTHFEPKAEVEDSLFTIEPTEDMTVIDLDEVSPETPISIDEFQKLSKEGTLYFPEDDALEIESIILFEMEEMPDSYTISYIDNGLPFASLEISEASSEWLPFGDDYEEIRTKEHVIYVESLFEQDVYTWEENGIKYELWMNDPSVTQEEVLRMIKRMEMVHEM